MTERNGIQKAEDKLGIIIVSHTVYAKLFIYVMNMLVFKKELLTYRKMYRVIFFIYEYRYLYFVAELVGRQIF